MIELSNIHLVGGICRGGGAVTIDCRSASELESMCWWLVQVVISCVDSACSIVFSAWVGCVIDIPVLVFSKLTRVIK